LEEPVIAEDFSGYRRIAAALKTRIVGGESHFTRQDLRPFFEAPHPVPILQPDPMRGGFTELRKIAAAADHDNIGRAGHRWDRATPWRSCSSGPRASRSLMRLSERDARGPEEHEKRRHRVARSQR
ncbi:MAG TPA: enolase C-terminal domain-like protein, partial [Reyranella sp.]|nr:enolase C-terminal domain-like protein [Reyranella sp.]